MADERADERRGFFGGALRRLKGLFDEVSGALSEPEEPRFVPPVRRPLTPDGHAIAASAAAASHAEEAASGALAGSPIHVARVSARLCLNGNILVERVDPTQPPPTDPANSELRDEADEADEDVEVCERCLVWCPVPGALTIDPERGTVVPRVDAALCTGCGECVSHCAAYPGALHLTRRPDVPQPPQ